jgi:hypothetical protein
LPQLKKKPTSKLVIHIGMPKTGTTILQSSLHAGREVLEKQGWIYATFSQAPQAGRILRLLLPESRFKDMPRLSLISPHEVYSSVQDFLKANVSHNLIVSSEHFGARLTNPSEIEGLRNLVAPFSDSPQIVCYFREQASAIVSMYSQSVKATCAETFDGFLDQRIASGRNLLLNEVAGRWSAVFGIENCHFRLYRKNSDWSVLQDFSSWLGLSDLPVLDDHYSNRSLSSREIEALRIVNSLLPSKFAHPATSKVSRHLKRFARRLASRGQIGSPIQISRKQEEKVQNAFRESNLDFFETYRPSGFLSLDDAWAFWAGDNR